MVDAAASSCVIAAAGHPPPVRAVPDGPARLIELPAGLPLGLGAGSVEATEVGLPPGVILALYSDGLVETRNGSLGDGIAALRCARALGAVPRRSGGGTLDGCCEAVTQALRPQGEDDVTLVLARIQP